MPRDFFPRQDLLALNWSKNFRDRLLSDPGKYHFSPQQAAEYAQAHEDFAEKLRIRLDPATATRSATAAKNTARQALEELLRPMVKQIQGRPSLSPADKIDIGIRDRKKQARWPRPDTAPGIRILRVVTNRVTIQLTDEPTGRFGKPPQVLLATVFYHVGEEYPVKQVKWALAMQSTRARFTVTLPPSIPAGTTVWFSAIWHNHRRDSSPYATPVATCTSYGVPMQRRLSAAAA
jgi:hypothetical protein